RPGRPPRAACRSSGAGRPRRRWPPSRRRWWPGRTGTAPPGTSPASPRTWPAGRDTPASAPSSWRGSRRAPAWRASAGHPGRIEKGTSLAGISREAGLNKDWLSRHLGSVDPVAAEAARHRRPRRLDARWLPALRRLGFADVPGYLHERHTVQHRTVNAIAAEV